MKTTVKTITAGIILTASVFGVMQRTFQQGLLK